MSGRASLPQSMPAQWTMPPMALPLPPVMPPLPAEEAAEEQADLGPEIPQLREKEKERKGSGVPLYAGSGSGPSGAWLGESIASGAIRVGAGTLQPGFLGSARIAAAIARLLGTGTSLGAFFASRAGSFAVLFVMAACALLAGALAIRFGGQLAPFAESSPMPVASRGDAGSAEAASQADSLRYAAGGKPVGIQWDGADAKQAKRAEQKDAAEVAKAAENVTQPEQVSPLPYLGDAMEQVAAAKGKLGDGFIKGFGSEAGSRSMASALGLRDSLAALPAVKLPAGANMPKPGNLGKTGAYKRGMKALMAGHRSTMNAASSRAMGQLKFAKAMSVSGNEAALDSQMKQFAIDAFEQGKTVGGQLAVPVGGENVVPQGDGAPGVTEAVPDYTGENVTPYQGNVDAAQGLDNAAAQNKNTGDMLEGIGTALMMAGIALMAAGAAMMCCPMTAAIGAALMAAGAALMAIGMMMQGMGQSMKQQAQQQAQQAQQQGNQIQQQYGQPDQNGVIGECAGLAANAGVAAAGCPGAAGAGAAAKAGANDVDEAVEEEARADYVLDDQ